MGPTPYPYPHAAPAAYGFQGASYSYPPNAYAPGSGMQAYPCWPASHLGGGYPTAGWCTWGPQKTLTYGPGTYGPSNPRLDILARLQVCYYTKESAVYAIPPLSRFSRGFWNPNG